MDSLFVVLDPCCVGSLLVTVDISVTGGELISLVTVDVVIGVADPSLVVEKTVVSSLVGRVVLCRTVDDICSVVFSVSRTVTVVLEGS